MAKPTQNLPDSRILTANGSYYFDVQQLTNMLISVKGTWGGGTVTLLYYDPNTDSYKNIAGASWTADFEQRLVPPSGGLLLVLGASAGASLSMTYGPINQTVK